jgi:hypothetical protein
MFASTSTYRLRAGREGCTKRQVEEFWANHKQGAVAKYLSEEPKDCVSGTMMQAGEF